MPAVANAVYDAVGVRVDCVPCQPHMVLRALRDKQKGKSPRFGPTKVPDYKFPDAAPMLHAGAGRRRPRGRRARAQRSWRPGRRATRRGIALVLRLPRFTLVEPRTLAEAVRARADAGDDAMYVAGGTDLWPNMKRRQMTPAHGDRALRASRSSREIRIASDGGVTIGAGASLEAVARHPLVRAKYAAVAHAAEVVSTPTLRHMGTHRRQPAPRHALQLLRSNRRMAPLDRLLHEEGRQDLLGRAVEPALLGRAEL